MRVLIHTDEYSPTAQACANRMRSFSDALTAAGAEVIVICSRTNLESGKPKEGPERVVYVPAYRMRKKTALQRLLNNITFLISSWFRSIRFHQIDAVITTSPPPIVSLAGWAAARTKKAKLIYDVRDIWPDVGIEMGSRRLPMRRTSCKSLVRPREGRSDRCRSDCVPLTADVARFHRASTLRLSFR